jgi:hypothetical protein
MIDPAFVPFSEILRRMLAVDGLIVDEAAGVSSHVVEIGIETPIELDVVRDEHGALRIGSTPPIYRVATTFLPSFHRVTFTARADGHTDGD